MITLPIQTQLIVLPILIFSIVFHEFAHTYVAILLGDRSASNMERLTLNPLKHLDPLGTLMIYFVGFGFAKPVRIDPRRFKKPVRDEILVGLAGPASNFMMAFIVLGIFRILIGQEVAMSNNVVLAIQYGAFINIGLGIFNMIPIPPLDGSHLYTSWLYQKRPDIYRLAMRYGSMVLFGVIILNRYSPYNLLPINRLVEGVMSFFIKILFSGPLAL